MKITSVEWRLHFLWPSLLAWISGGNVTAGLVENNFLCIGIGLFLIPVVIYLIYKNQKDFVSNV